MRKQLREIAALFLRLGATAFGGPAAHIALMERAVVRDRRWVDHEEFADLLGAASLLPGPTSTESSTAAAICCSRCSGTSWSRGAAGSTSGSSWMQSRRASSRPAR